MKDWLRSTQGPFPEFRRKKGVYRKISGSDSLALQRIHAQRHESEAQMKFESKKRKYFSTLALRVKDTLKLHKAHGLWDRKDGRRDWGNVSEHCLVEMARVEEFAKLLRLSDEMCQKLLVAAALHDFNKRGEIEHARAHGGTWESFDETGAQATRAMHEAHIPTDVIRIANSTGHSGLLETEDVLARGALSEEDIAFLILRYVDDYTENDTWADPATVSTGGLLENALDRRVAKSERNPNYRTLNEQAPVHLVGRDLWTAQREVGHANEERLAQMLTTRSGEKWEPKQLPERIDERVKRRIVGTA